MSKGSPMGQILIFFYAEDLPRTLLILEAYTDRDDRPIRIRYADEDGDVQVHTIKEYRDLSHRGTFTNPDGVYITNEMLVFLCKISAFGQDKRIMLYYDASKSKWMMSA